MVSNAFDMSKKIANVMYFDLLSFAVDMSFSKCNIGCIVEYFNLSHIGVYK